jgi:hypothetical protein
MLRSRRVAFLAERMQILSSSSYGMSDEQYVNAVHSSNRLPARLTIYLAVLPSQVVRIVKDCAGCLEVDTVLSLVDPVLSFIPGKFHGRLCNGEYV